MTERSRSFSAVMTRGLVEFRIISLKERR